MGLSLATRQTKDPNGARLSSKVVSTLLSDTTASCMSRQDDVSHSWPAWNRDGLRNLLAASVMLNKDATRGVKMNTQHSYDSRHV